MTPHSTVVVIGGGYAGVMAANRIAGRDDARILLVNPRPTFVERIRLHQLVLGSDDALIDYPKVLAEQVQLITDTVTHIEPAGRTVTLASGETLRYHHLVYAVGSLAAGFGTDAGTRAGADAGTGRQVSGAAEHAYPVATLEDAQRLRPVLDATPTGAPLAVVGGGATGIETAAELAEAGRPVTLICGAELGGYLHPRARRAVARRLAALGVTVLAGPDATATAVTATAVHLADGQEIPAAVTIWTVGFAVPDLAARSGLATDALGRLRTDETLTSISDPHIVAAGDAAAPSDVPLRMSCQAATVLGLQAANTVLSHLAGETPTPLNQGFAGQCLSLGRRAGIVQFAHRDDTATPVHLGGRPGATLKELVCRQTIAGLAREARRPGSTRWLHDTTRPHHLPTPTPAPATVARPTSAPAPQPATVAKVTATLSRH